VELPTPDKVGKERSTISDAEEFFNSEAYHEALTILAKAKAYIDKTVGKEDGLDYMISEIKKLFTDGYFSDHCYDYAEREAPPLTEAQLAEMLPKTEDGKPIFSWRDL